VQTTIYIDIHVSCLGNSWFLSSPLLLPAAKIFPFVFQGKKSNSSATIASPQLHIHTFKPHYYPHFQAHSASISSHVQGYFCAYRVMCIAFLQDGTYFNAPFWGATSSSAPFKIKPFSRTLLTVFFFAATRLGIPLQDELWFRPVGPYYSTTLYMANIQSLPRFDQ
jgi:hypothetical protein